MSGELHALGKNPGSHWSGGWVGSQSQSGCLEKRKSSRPYHSHINNVLINNSDFQSSSLEMLCSIDFVDLHCNLAAIFNLYSDWCSVNPSLHEDMSVLCF